MCPDIFLYFYNLIINYTKPPQVAPIITHNHIEHTTNTSIIKSTKLLPPPSNYNIDSDKLLPKSTKLLSTTSNNNIDSDKLLPKSTKLLLIASNNNIGSNTQLPKPTKLLSSPSNNNIDSNERLPKATKLLSTSSNNNIAKSTKLLSTSSNNNIDSDKRLLKSTKLLFQSSNNNIDSDKLLSDFYIIQPNKNKQSTCIILPGNRIYDNRPTFKCNFGDIRAGGVLFYKIVDDIKQYLVIITKGVYSDLGGKSELCDKTIYDTIAREVNEESTNFYTTAFVYNRIINEQPIYLSKAKYILFVLPIDSQYLNIDNDDLCWMTSDILKEKSHPRLKEIIDDL